jgi:crotonobetainyl-CoA:carnitine CoA-transferase CaiB-like acyl-CoA transferase
VAVADIAAGLHAAIAILAALRHRDATGDGQSLDVSLFDASLALLVNVASSTLIADEAPRRWGNAHPSIVPYQTFPTADMPVMLAVGNDMQFGALAAILDEPGWSIDPRFATNPARVRHREVLVPMIERHLARRPASFWLEAMEGAGIPAGPVRTVPEALASPEAAQRGMVVDLAIGGDAAMKTLGPVPKLFRTPARVGPPPPRLGEHTAEVLRGMLGYDDSRIADLCATGAIA